MGNFIDAHTKSILEKRTCQKGRGLTIFFLRKFVFLKQTQSRCRTLRRKEKYYVICTEENFLYVNENSFFAKTYAKKNFNYFWMHIRIIKKRMILKFSISMFQSTLSLLRLKQRNAYFCGQGVLWTKKRLIYVHLISRTTREGGGGSRR